MRLYRMRHTGNRESDCPASAARRRGPGSTLYVQSRSWHTRSRAKGIAVAAKARRAGKRPGGAFERRRADPRRQPGIRRHGDVTGAVRRMPGGASAARAQAQRRRPTGSLRAEPERAPPPGSGGASAAGPTRQGRRPRSPARARERQSERGAGPGGGQGAQRRAGGLPPEPPCDSMGLFFANAKYNRLDLTFLS